jgi:uncharacterized Fe-S center protein
VISNMGSLQIPEEMRLSTKAWPILYVRAKNLDLWRTPSGVAYLLGDFLVKKIKQMYNRPMQGQVLLKVHIGEPNCITRMRPEYVVGSEHWRFLQEAEGSGIVSGDTTVAYSGPRGHKENPVGDSSKYLQLARKHGWSSNGKSGVPFVILDRPLTAKEGAFEFNRDQEWFELEGVNHFKDFYVAGGFTAADFLVNHAHLTLHGLAGLAGCVKSIAMGCSSLTGKLRMHQSLLPHFDAELCVCCGRCVESCPEGALQLNESDLCPSVNPDLCIGCGECEATCAMEQGAVKMQGKEITDWDRGGETLPVRMADYTVGIMNRRWERAIHVLHMYAITKRCDCVNTRQEPLLKRDLGFLVGKNPFAIDSAAAQLMAEVLQKQGHTNDEPFLKSIKNSADYVRATYGIITEAPIQRISIS